MVEFLYKFLFHDSKTNTLSHTKLWSNVGMFAMTIAFGFYVYTAPFDIMLWTIYGAIVVGNRTLNKLIATHYNSQEKQ